MHVCSIGRGMVGVEKLKAEHRVAMWWRWWRQERPRLLCGGWQHLLISLDTSVWWILEDSPPLEEKVPLQLLAPMPRGR